MSVITVILLASFNCPDDNFHSFHTNFFYTDFSVLYYLVLLTFKVTTFQPFHKLVNQITEQNMKLPKPPHAGPEIHFSRNIKILLVYCI